MTKTEQVKNIDVTPVNKEVVTPQNQEEDLSKKVTRGEKKFRKAM